MSCLHVVCFLLLLQISNLMDVPLVRSQLRRTEMVNAMRLYRQGINWSMPLCVGMPTGQLACVCVWGGGGMLGIIALTGH